MNRVKPAKSVKVDLTEDEYRALFETLTRDHHGPNKVGFHFNHFVHDVVTNYADWRQKVNTSCVLETVDIKDVFEFLLNQDIQKKLLKYLSSEVQHIEAAEAA